MKSSRIRTRFSYFSLIILAFVCMIASSNRTSAIVSGCSLSSMTMTFVQSAPAASNLGFMVSPRPSSAV